MREFLKGLDLDKELVDTIMAEHGKVITESKEQIIELKAKVSDLEVKSKELGKLSEEKTKVEKELETLRATKVGEEKIKKEKEEEEELTNNIKKEFGNKKFVNEFTENHILNEIKKSLKENKEKTAKELFEELTKDKDGIFKSDNTLINMPDSKEIDKNVSKDNHERELIGLSTVEENQK